MALVTVTVPRFGGVNRYNGLMHEGLVEILVNGEPIGTSERNNYGRIVIDIDPVKIDDAAVTTVVVKNNKIDEVFDLDTISFKVPPKTMTSDFMEWEVTPDNWGTMIVRSVLDFLPYLEFTARPSSPVEDYPFLKIYKVDDDNLKILSNEVEERKGKVDTAPDGSIVKDYDVTNHIVNLLRIPYPIESEDELISINMKNEAMESEGQQIGNYLQIVNLGSISCAHDILAGIGYKNVEFNLFVPNFKPISLNVAKTIGRTIDIKLIIDLTTGKGTLNLSIDSAVFHIESSMIAKEIPFRSDNITISLGSDVLDVDFIKPYLEISVLDPNNAINMNVLKQRGINKSSYKYLKTDSIFLNTRANYLEQLEIESLVRKGVYING